MLTACSVIWAGGATFAGTFRYMWKNEGVLSFWKGNGANVMKIAPESAFKFYANEIFKEQIAQDPRSVQPHERLLYVCDVCCKCVCPSVGERVLFS
eukprot:m.582995 g.582995  ORF g.582995 m.582995 type:complete len:96 (-) comp22338_c0_seq21:1929-2216(-)